MDEIDILFEMFIYHCAREALYFNTRDYDIIYECFKNIIRQSGRNQAIITPANT